MFRTRYERLRIEGHLRHANECGGAERGGDGRQYDRPHGACASGEKISLGSGLSAPDAMPDQDHTREIRGEDQPVDAGEECEGKKVHGQRV